MLPFKREMLLLARGLTCHSTCCLQIVTNKKAGETYVLYQCGTPQPGNDADGVADLTDPKFFQIPLYKVAATDTTALAFMVSN